MPQVFWKLYVPVTIVVAVVTVVGWNQSDSAVAQQGETNAAVVDRADQPAESAEDDLQSPLLIEPEMLSEVFDAVVLMEKIARPKLAQRYLAQFMQRKPSDELLLKLRDKHGPAFFLKLANNKQLQPLSAQLLDRVNQAFRKLGADPKRTDALIADLSGTQLQRESAIIALRRAGAVVVPRILSYLSAPKTAEQHDLLLYTLTQIGRPAIHPLLGALDSPQENVRSMAIEALGWLGSRDVVPYLWYPAFAEKQPTGVRSAGRQALARILGDGKVGKALYRSTSELMKIATRHYRNEFVWKDDLNGTVDLWQWLPETETVALTKVSPERASLHAGTRFAQQALELSPENRDAQALFLCLALASEAHVAGWGQPLPTGPGTAHNLALAAGADAVSKSLALALKNARPASALAALQVLSQVGTKHQLTKQSPVLSALNYPGLRVQFAAATTVMQLDPDQAFRGARRVVAIFNRALNDNGAAHSLVVDASVRRSSTLSGLLGEMGYLPQLASTGRRGFRIASERMDVELIVLHINTIRWGLSQTIANLRTDSRTASIPIAIYGPGEMKHRVTTLLQKYPSITYLIESVTVDHVESQLRPFLKSIETPPLQPAERAQQTSRAAYWLAHIANGQRTSIFNIASAEQGLVLATNDPRLAGDALVALGAIPSKRVQRLFQKIAVTTIADVELRETAALQLAFHIQRFGLLLSLKEVSEIKVSWRETTHPQVATALASVVGSLKPDANRVGSRLRRFQRPAVSAP